MEFNVCPAIGGLKPERFWRCFAELSRIPRPSGHEERAAQFVLDRAQSLGLEARKDGFGNVVVKKPASKRRDGLPSVCLQSHLDMVCEKNATKAHDFMSDPIELLRDGNFVTADGTTLGADNGVGVATSLAIMEDADLEHGPLELLFTVEEETGLTGVLNLTADLVTSRILLNLDSEDEGVIFIGCAGGRDTVGKWTLAKERPSTGFTQVRIMVRGLKGGHSGIDIGRGLGNAIKILNRAIIQLGTLGLRLSSLEGGNMRNAIPRECSAVAFLPKERLDDAKALVNSLNSTYRAEFASVDPDLELTLAEELGGSGEVITASLQERLCRTIAALPSGVQHMSADMPGLVESSTNVSVIRTHQDTIELITSQRSSVASRLAEVAETVEAALCLGGAEVTGGSGYPGWKPNVKSPILAVAKEKYHALYGKEPEVTAVHAGLECGIIGERIPGIDMISFGPTLHAVHSPDERIDIASVPKFWDFLVEILKAVR
ncbi:aminoacyl-histidine dipeptidase [Geomonas sp. Red276]